MAVRKFSEIAGFAGKVHLVIENFLGRFLWIAKSTGRPSPVSPASRQQKRHRSAFCLFAW
jgi:hypothetical protein